MITINEKQKLFCGEYIKDFNPEAAAVRAGYSDKNAAWRLLQREDIQNELILCNSRKYKSVATQDEILQFYTAIMRREVFDELALQNKEKTTRTDDDGNKVNEEKTFITTVPQRVKLSDAISAADKLHRYYMSKQEQAEDTNSGIVILPEVIE